MNMILFERDGVVFNMGVVEDRRRGGNVCRPCMWHGLSNCPAVTDIDHDCCSTRTHYVPADQSTAEKDHTLAHRQKVEDMTHRLTIPTRLLCSTTRPLAYVHSTKTDIRLTFAKYAPVALSRPLQSKLS